MAGINSRISYMYVEYTIAFHVKFMHLFADTIYDYEQVSTCPLIITWAELNMEVEDGSKKCLVVSTKSAFYDDSYKVSEELFEDAIQAYVLFPDNPNDDDDNSNELRLEFVKALLNK